jgi:acyl-CoA synthetase (AMP-forming)/AMP-acid ligase II
MVLVAAFCEGCTVIPVPPGAAVDTASIIERFDPSLVIVASTAPIDGPATVRVDRHGLPASDAVRRTMRMPGVPGVRLVLATSGTSGRAKLVGLSDANILSVVESHRDAFELEEGEVCLSLLPWDHAFGLIIDLLPAILSGCCVVRDDDGGRSADKVLRLSEQHQITWCSMVPLQVERLIDYPAGESFLRGLRGGVVGGASASPRVCASLERTQLRVGYGQTEASPGITLGDPGDWSWREIGRAVGCEVRLRSDSHLLCRGPNVFAASWDPSTGFAELAPNRWIDTGDLVEPGPRGSLRFVGRSDRATKLANGRLVDAPRLELAIVQAVNGAAYASIQSTDDARLTVDVFIDHRGGSLADDIVARVKAEAARTLGATHKIVDQIRVLPLAEASRDTKGAPRRVETRDGSAERIRTIAFAA